MIQFAATLNYKSLSNAKKKTKKNKVYKQKLSTLTESTCCMPLKVKTKTLKHPNE